MTDEDIHFRARSIRMRWTRLNKLPTRIRQKRIGLSPARLDIKHTGSFYI